MGYYATGNGSVTFIVSSSETVKKVSEILTEVFETDLPLDPDKESECTICFWGYDKYYEDAVLDALEAVSDSCKITEGEVDYIGEDYEMWRFIYIPKRGWVCQQGHVEYDE